MEVTSVPRRPLVLLVISLVTAIGIAADLGWRQHIRPRFAVEVDGQVLGALREPAVAEEVLQTLQSQITPEMQVHVNLATKINVRPLGAGERMGCLRGTVRAAGAPLGPAGASRALSRARRPRTQPRQWERPAASRRGNRQRGPA